MIDKLKTLLEESERILITSHIGPDGDAVSSAALLYKTLLCNYPDKQIFLCMEESSPQLSFIPGYEDIKSQSLSEGLSEFKPDLFILLDANNLARASREPEAARQALAQSQAKYVIIDHHEPAGRDEADVYINQNSPACAQDVYEIFFEQLKLKKPADYAQTALFGIYSDTGGLVYQNARHKKTLELVSQLLDAGASLENIKFKIERYSADQLRVLAHLFENQADFEGFTFSFISDEFKDSWLNSGKDRADLKVGCEMFVNIYARNIDGRTKGFVIYPDLLAPQKTYGASFRAVGNATDVSVIASSLGGGGHKPAAGAKIRCESVQEALEKVKDAINSSK